MVVNLDFALEGDKVVHIKDRLSRDMTYKCPFCGDEVGYRKGSEREHCFYHKNLETCNPTKETLLHYDSKHYLSNFINNTDYRVIGKDLYFTVNWSLLDADYYKILKNLGMTMYSISLKELLSYYSTFYSEVEKTVSTFKADVCVVNKTYSTNPLVFEIFVTHKNEEEKVKYLKDSNIPYLELKPTRTSEGFIYEVVDFNLEDFLEYKYSTLRESILNLVYKDQKEELKSKVSEEVRVTIKEQLEKDIKNEFLMEARKDISNINLRDFIKKSLYKEMNSIDCLNSKVKNRPLKRRERYYNFETKIHKGNKILIANMGNYYVTDPLNMLSSLINQLSNHYDIEILIADIPNYNRTSNREEVIGFNLMLYNEKSKGIELKS
ncbi:hypothetical protein GH891_31540, partial [Bacillus thuringiensis]|nr:hypothetical protein [Bacillus thuringiensis]